MKIEKIADWLKFLMEDILRLSREKNSDLTLKEISEECQLGKDEILKAVKELERKGFITFHDEIVSLTSKGVEESKAIYNFHKTLEETFDHTVAHAMEHFGKITENVKKLERSMKSLEEFKEDEQGIITCFKIVNPKIISRLLGVGISPITSFRVIKVRKDEIILEINDRIVVIERDLGKKIMGAKKIEGS